MGQKHIREERGSAHSEPFCLLFLNDVRLYYTAEDLFKALI